MQKDHMARRKEHTYIVMWCEEGLEGILTVDHDALALEEQQKIADILSDTYDEDTGTKVLRQLSSNLRMMTLRAGLNSHRNYEIYQIVTSSSVDETMLRQQFHDDPQNMVNLIRQKGSRIYGSSGRSKPPCIL